MPELEWLRKVSFLLNKKINECSGKLSGYKISVLADDSLAQAIKNLEESSI
ncbi:hypothetical protein ACW5XW_00970 [Aeromonas piscicola]|uniref:hypothetical protein n=1 Tax=Aeromonas piscicola TaxID=600645 RepID=UPI0012E07740|nr:hypothetical protein [Aeromonas piscicola]